jgi:two-component system, LuxR family, sensor kinase FixL
MYSKETLAFMEAAVDAVIVIDHRGRMTAINHATTRLFGYTSTELLGENVSKLMPEPDRSHHNQFMRRYLDTGEARIIGIGREVTAQRRDGSLFPVRLTVGRVPDTDPPRFVGMVRDVSPEHTTLAALKLERDRANAYLELNDAILLKLDSDHRIFEINARGADLLRATPDSLRGRNWLEFMRPGAERERAQFMLAGARSSRGSREQEFDAIDCAGEPRRIQWRCIALSAADGAPSGWLVSGADCTERQRREENAALAQERLTRVARLASMGEMASGVAHELNQPLTAITTYARACERYLAMAEPDMAEITDAVREIGAEGLRAGRIIDRLRQLVRNDEPTEMVLLDINTVVEDLHALLLSEARMFEARLEFSLAPGLPKIRGDAAQIQQVILNLVRNAFEALLGQPPANREVRLLTSLTEAGEMELLVSDNGPGFPQEIRARLFHPFATTKRSGTGLGLAMCRTIVHALGGTIGTRPDSPQGAGVFVRLRTVEEGQ